ncbi:MAG: sulfotransferase [Alphaproteobacteria bacterium]
MSLTEARRLRAAGRPDDAATLLKRLARENARNPDIQHELGLALLDAGDARRSLKPLAAAVKLAPRTAGYHTSLGVAHARLSDPRKAAFSFSRAAGLSPGNALNLINLGVSHQEAGDFDKAADAFRKAAATDTSGRADKLLGLLLLQQEKYHEAHDALNKAAATLSGDAEIFNALGYLETERGNFCDAIAHLETALCLNPYHEPAMVNLGNALKGAGDTDSAIERYRQAIALDPESTLAYRNLGNTYRSIGQTAEAADCFDTACRLEPGNGQLHRLLSTVRTFSTGDALIAAMTEAYDRTGRHSTDRMHFCFALWKAYDDTGDPEKAFPYLAEGNAIRRKQTPYLPEATQQYIDRVKALSTGLPSQIDTEGPTPVFIVGLPRSGTSLVEQILASHPSVHGCGELPYLEAIADELLDNSITPAEAADRYRHASQPLDTDAACFTDKMPDNFRYIGLITRLFPSARILHCRRDPVETCFSIFKHYFPAKRMTYAFGLDDLADYYRQYDSLMQHWREALPGRIQDVDYEDLVTDPEPVIRNMLTFCGLDWHDDCLHFHRADRVVKTASAEQVRQPLYRDALAASRPYAKWLAPLTEGLSD